MPRATWKSVKMNSASPHFCGHVRTMLEEPRESNRKRTLWVELIPPSKDETAIPNAARMSPKAMIPLITECRANHQLAVVRPLAKRGTRTPMGRKHIVASAPHTTCATSILRFEIVSVDPDEDAEVEVVL